MGVCEERSTGGELVDVGRLDHGVRIHAADPVVLVIDSDEENVGLFRGGTCESN